MGIKEIEMETKAKEQVLRGALVVAAAALAAGVVVFGAAVSQAQTTDAPSICPPADPPACMARCLVSKRKCWNACRTRKRQCLEEARSEATACKLECRETSPDNIGQCKRRCIAAAIAKARRECRLGVPVCVRQCNPEPCRELCSPAADASSSTNADVDTVCDPPADRNCLGQCAVELKQCAARVYREGRQCIAGCRELRGPERRQCVRDCVDTTVAAGKQCLTGFRECVGGCKPVTDPPVVDPPVTDPPAMPGMPGRPIG